MDFDDMGMNPCLRDNVHRLGFDEPTPIQEQAFAAIASGRDVMGLAQTGTGKTAAFALPILQRLMTSPCERLRVLVIAPTRELAEQLFQAFGELGQGSGCRGVTVYGGVAIGPQKERLAEGVDVAIACPGRLLDHLQQDTIDVSAVDTLVLDEADQMLDMGFVPAIRDIIKRLPTPRQTLMFSATMPDSIRAMANEFLTDPALIQVEHDEPLATVSHALYPVAAHCKRDLLLELLKQTDTESVLIFARTKYRASKVGRQLQQAGLKAAALQGNLSQNHRRAVMDGFRSGKHQILVATDIAARGIDVSAISHVINFDIPDTVDAYTHRIGRTGRAARTGDAFTLVTPEDTDMVRRIERVLGAEIERRTIEGFDYDRPAPPRNDDRSSNQNTPRKPARQKQRPRQPEAAAPKPAKNKTRRPTKRPDTSPQEKVTTTRSGQPLSGQGVYVPETERPIILSHHAAAARPKEDGRKGRPGGRPQRQTPSSPRYGSRSTTPRRGPSRRDGNA